MLNATSKCPYGECDGLGVTYKIDRETGIQWSEICKCKKDEIQDGRLKFANIPTEFDELTVRSFETNIYKSQESTILAINAKKSVANYINNFEKFVDYGKGLYFYSATRGSGKTRLAVSLGNVLLKQMHKQVKFVTSIDLLNEIKSTFDDKSEYTQSQLIESINGVDILIIDDIGVEKPTDWVNEVLFGIFDNRMKYKKITIFTSNCSMDELKHDDRLKSRITKMCIPIKMPDEDIRRKKSKTENEILQDLLLENTEM